MRHLLFLLLGVSLIFGACQKTHKTPSGFEYVHHVSKGGKKPAVGDYAYCNIYICKGDSVVYSTLMDGIVAKLPIEDPKKLNAMQQPIIEGLMVMGVGDSLTVTQNIDTMKVKPQGFDNAKSISYRISLLEIKNKAAYEKDLEAEKSKMDTERQQFEAINNAYKAMKPYFQGREKAAADSLKTIADAYAAGKLNGEIKKTASGLKYMILTEGTGAQAANGKIAFANYYGTLTNSKHFDDSFHGGEPFVFRIGQHRVIQGWEEGFTLLKEGSRAVLFVPYQLGFGETGTPDGKIPAKSEVLFYVELLKTM